jgi:hypothetical protein
MPLYSFKTAILLLVFPPTGLLLYYGPFFLILRLLFRKLGFLDGLYQLDNPGYSLAHICVQKLASILLLVVTPAAVWVPVVNSNYLIRGDSSLILLLPVLAMGGTSLALTLYLLAGLCVALLRCCRHRYKTR